MNNKRAFLAGGLCAVVVVGWMGHAEAQECSSDADCDAGFACEVVGSGDCPAIDCAPGELCPEPEPCEPQTFSECVPGACSTDADCGADLVCITTTYEECGGGEAIPECPPDTKCTEPVPPEPTEPTCREVSESYCGPKWVAPCTVDADCGEGFSCVELESCGCSGSSGGGTGGASGSDGGLDPDQPPAPEPAPTPGAMPPYEPQQTPPDDCTCVATGEFYCEPARVVCETPANCPTDWSCEPDPNAPVSGGTCMAAPGEEPVCTTEPTPAPENVCLPPYWDYGFGYGGVNEGGFGAPTRAGADGSGSGNDEVGGENPPAEPSPQGSDPGSSSGCSVASGASSAPDAGWLALLGLGVGGLIRRRRRA